MRASCRVGWAILLWIGATASAAEVYRCVAPSGTVAYQAVPCEGGRRIDAVDSRTEDQRREAQHRLRDDRRAASLPVQQAHSSPSVGATVIGQRPTLSERPKPDASRRKPPRVRGKVQGTTPPPAPPPPIRKP